MDTPQNKQLASLHQHIADISQHIGVGLRFFERVEHPVLSSFEYQLYGLSQIQTKNLNQKLHLQYHAALDSTLYDITIDGYKLHNSISMAFELTIQAKESRQIAEQHLISQDRSGKPSIELSFILDKSDPQSLQSTRSQSINQMLKFSNEYSNSAPSNEQLNSTKVSQQLLNTNLYKLMTDLRVYNACLYQIPGTSLHMNHLSRALFFSTTEKTQNLLHTGYTILSCCKDIDNTILQEIPTMLVKIGEQEAQKLMQAFTDMNRDIGKISTFVRQ